MCLSRSRVSTQWTATWPHCRRWWTSPKHCSRSGTPTLSSMRPTPRGLSAPADAGWCVSWAWRNGYLHGYIRLGRPLRAMEVCVCFCSVRYMSRLTWVESYYPVLPARAGVSDQLRPPTDLHHCALLPVARCDPRCILPPRSRWNRARKLTPSLLGSVITQAPPQLQSALHSNISHVHRLLVTLPASQLITLPPPLPTTPILLLLTPQPRSMATWLQQQGIVARPIVYPTVPPGRERVRVCVHAGNSSTQIERLVAGIRTWLEAQEEEEGGAGRESKL